MYHQSRQVLAHIRWLERIAGSEILLVEIGALGTLPVGIEDPGIQLAEIASLGSQSAVVGIPSAEV